MLYLPSRLAIHRRTCFANKKPPGPGGGQGVIASSGARTAPLANLYQLPAINQQLTRISFRELRLLIRAGAPDAAGAGASVVVKDEPAVRGRARQGAVAVGDGGKRVDRIRWR